MTEKAWAVVVAAGRGTRFGGSFNKVFYRLNGRAVLSRCLKALEDSRLFEGIVLVLNEDDRPLYREMIDRDGAPSQVRSIAPGGQTRQESVLHGLQQIPSDVRYVAIHDAARPFVTAALIRECLETAAAEGSAVPGLKVTDTVKLTDENGYAIETPARDRLCAVQTPQTFRLNDILRAHRLAEAEGLQCTDDAALYEKYIGKVKLVIHPDCADNIKVTTRRDVREEAPCSFRTGWGYDAHRLTEGRKLILCGVDIPYEKGLLGHSDADVAVHALMDALLGAAALGDIGRHFPDTDERYRGISSLLLLEQVMNLLREKGFVPVNADVTVIAQRPKLKDYMETMRDNLCSVMALPTDCVNVKATTTEKMGFEGSGEGISSQAVVMLAKVNQKENLI